MRSVNLEKWRGKRDPVALDPAGIEFKAITGRKGCAGCMFEGQWSSTCKKAASEAARRSKLIVMKSLIVIYLVLIGNNRIRRAYLNENFE